jgi:hypothetical protein
MPPSSSASSARESFVFAEAEAPGYIERRDGRLWLTMAGDALFRDGSSEPEIFAVEPRRREVGFDLMSLAPRRPRFLSEFELGLPELMILDKEAAGSAATRIPQAFRRFFSEVADRRERSKGEKKDLYSVDPVTSKNRFLSTMRTVVRAQASYPSSEESDLILWRPEHEQADRPEIVSSVASFVDGLKQSRSEGDAEAYNVLINLAPDFGRGLKQAEELAFTARIATEEACPGLLHHLLDTRRHLIKFLAQAFQRRPLQDGRRPLHALNDLLREALCLSNHPAGYIQ